MHNAVALSVGLTQTPNHPTTRVGKEFSMMLVKIVTNNHQPHCHSYTAVNFAIQA